MFPSGAVHIILIDQHITDINTDALILTQFFILTRNNWAQCTTQVRLDGGDGDEEEEVDRTQLKKLPSSS